MPFNDQFAVRAVVDWSTLDGYWDMVDPGTGDVLATGGGRDSVLTRLSARWQPGEKFQADFKFEYQEIERDNPYAWQPGRCGNLYGLGLSTQAELDQFWADTGSADPSPLSLPFTCGSTFVDSVFDSRSPAAPFNTSDFESMEGLARLAWELGETELVSTTAYFDMDFAFAGNDLTHGAPGNRPLWLADGTYQWSQELRLTSNSPGPFEWLIGVYWQSGDVAYQTGDADGRNPMNPQFIRTEASQDDRTTSMFGSISRTFNERWTAGVGLRWTETEKTFSGVDERIRSNTITPAERPVFAAQVFSDTSGDPSAYSAYERQIRGQFSNESRTFDDTAPSFNLQYQAREDLLAYYTWTTGQKSGGFNFRLNGLDASTLTYEAETVKAHELGVKGLFLEGRLRLGAAIFVSDYEDLQQNSNRGDGGVISAAVIRNAAEASSDGVELDIAWQLSDSFRVDLSATWLDAKFDSYQGADCTRLQSVVSTTDVASLFGAQRDGNRCSQDLSGGKLAHAPDFAGRLGISHQFVASRGWTVNSGIEWFYSDEFFTSPHADRLRLQPSFSKINARVDFGDRSNRWSLALIANNVTDELAARQLGQDQDAAVSGLVDDPRRIIFELLYAF
jgi:outer membrane receptor protein involved in Fe transport